MPAARNEISSIEVPGERSDELTPNINTGLESSSLQSVVYSAKVVPGRGRKNGTGRQVTVRRGSECPSQRVRRLVTLRLVREGSFPAPEGYPEGYQGRAVPMRSPNDVYEYMAPYAAREVCESFWILPLDSQNRVARAGPAVITRGILNSSLVHAREVFVVAILSSAAALILIHNHPSGDPAPSPEDRAVTAQLVSAGKLLGIDVLDHVIIGHDRFTSFAETGLI